MTYESILEFFHERAAIREYDCGYSRLQAEVLAKSDTIQIFGLEAKAIIEEYYREHDGRNQEVSRA